MAKTTGPLMSLDAHGSFGRVLTYSHRKSGRQVRKYTKPLVAASAKQRGQRRLTEFLVAQWQNMSAGDKATWEANARLSGPNITGYHFFLREAQRDLYTHTGLCGYWHCNEIVGGQVLDLSGNANHGDLEPGYPANAPVLVDSYKTKFSKGLLYDGIDEYVDCGNGARLNITDNITMEIWTRPDTLADVAAIIAKGSMRYGFEKVGGEIVFKPTFYIDDGWRGSKKTPYTPTQWLHLAATYSSSTRTITLIKNGLLVDTETLIGLASYTIGITAGAFQIGAQQLVRYYKGIIDEVCVYNRVLSVAEIATRYKFATREVD